MLNLSRTLAMALAMSAMQLSGAIIISSGPTNFAGDENLLFNAPGLNLVGLVVEGATNNTGFIIESRNAGESLTGNGGQARVEGTDGSFTAITFVPKLANVTFATMVLNINANVDGSVQFTVTPEAGPSFVQSFDVGGNGNNFFGIETTLGTRIRSVSLILSSNSNTPVGQTVFAEDIRQIRLGGTGAVPEPGTYLLTAAGLLALGAMRRRV